jgi:uncharacterized protein YbgA (DUF1722 family)/uncharacterized protein YbbK (DUF523 family)
LGNKASDNNQSEQVHQLQQNKIKIGASSCLLGEKVRYDSGHKKNQYLLTTLSQFFDFVSFCPEVAIGLGIPREAIHLEMHEDKIKCIGTRNTALDVTIDLQNIADEQTSWHSQISGYILKKDSPSCGMERVKIYHKDMPTKKGVGLYTQRLIENFPYLPMEEEGRLEDVHLRENFIARVYIYARWKDMFKERVTISQLQAFHANHKYIFMSHDQIRAKSLGALLAGNEEGDIESLAVKYFSDMMGLLKVVASKNNHVNTLHHIQGYLKNYLDADDKEELSTVIADYRLGLLPIIVPITLLRHHFRKHPNDYITTSFYMSPHPGELMLLNRL